MVCFDRAIHIGADQIGPAQLLGGNADTSAIDPRGSCQSVRTPRVSGESPAFGDPLEQRSQTC